MGEVVQVGGCGYVVMVVMVLECVVVVSGDGDRR